MGGKGKDQAKGKVGKQVAARTWNDRKCEQCGTREHLEIDPADEGVYYCISCWYTPSNEHTRSHGRGNSKEGKGQGKAGNGQGKESKGNGKEGNGQGKESKGNGKEGKGKGKEGKGKGKEGKGKGQGGKGSGKEAKGEGKEWKGRGKETNGKGKEGKGKGKEGKGKGKGGKGCGKEAKGEGKEWKGKGNQGKDTGKSWNGGSSKGGGRQWVPDPPVDEPGKWVAREDFCGRKSFAFYYCQCRKSWVSAHGYKEFRQGCQACNVESLPLLLWENEVRYTGFKLDEPGKVARDRDGPHDEQRCEACRAGVCDFFRQRM